jgi:hypothetical protein
MHWSGFAELVFADSALHAFARAAELADTDVHEQHHGAWAIDDRHLTFSLETDSSRAVMEAMQRFLGLLVLQAEEGEALIEASAPSSERWLRRAASPSISKELTFAVSDDAPQSKTIPMAG